MQFSQQKADISLTMPALVFTMSATSQKIFFLEKLRMKNVTISGSKVMEK